MTYEEEQRWRNLGPDAIDAEMERRMADYLARVRQCCVRRADRHRDEPSGWMIGTLFVGSRAACWAWIREHTRGGGRIWIERAEKPAYVHRRRATTHRMLVTEKAGVGADRWA